ncbi:MAG TPA: DUF3618 domain-containing protein [Candidatus Omnitrophota bacterium]|nr:DUF3618 domain-containing protein [Candidatus Omnitrophota bacterium]
MKTDDIQEEIERTRDEMASTLNAIEQKLSPRQLMDQAVDTMREIASDQSRVGAVVRDNPIPLALIGLGLGWLAISGMSSGRRSSRIDEEEGADYGSYESYEGVGLESTTSSSAWATPSTTGTSASGGYASSMQSGGYSDYTGSGGGISTGGNGHGIRERAGEVAGQARQNISRATERTRQRVGDWSRSARSQASMAADRTWEAYQEHPISMGFLAMMMGAAIGAILPRSRKEQEVMGSTARGVLGQARQAAGDIAERAGHVAEKAVETAREQGKEAIREVTEASKDEAKRQGLTGGASTSSTTTPSGSTLTH